MENLPFIEAFKKAFEELKEAKLLRQGDEIEIKYYNYRRPRIICFPTPKFGSLNWTTKFTKISLIRNRGINCIKLTFDSGEITHLLPFAGETDQLIAIICLRANKIIPTLEQIGAAVASCNPRSNSPQFFLERVLGGGCDPE